MKFLLPVLAIALLTSCKPSGLAWHKEFARVDLSPAETSHTVEFKFTNREAKPVRVVSVTPSCSSCTRVAWPETPVPAGGESSVKLTFEAANKSGVVSTSALVRDDQGRTSLLHAVFSVPKVVVLDPAHLRWRLGDQSRQTVKIWMNPEFPAVPTGVSDSGIAGLEPTLRKIDDRGHWELDLSPPQATARWQGKIEILTSRPEPRWNSLPLPLFVEQS